MIIIVQTVIRTLKISTYALPTLEEMMSNYNDLFYVREGFTKWFLPYLSSGNLYNEVMAAKFLPICSDPVDADSDNDGVMDRCDTNALDRRTRSLKDDAVTQEIFTVLKCFDGSNKINCYSNPRKETPQILFY